jgi:GNAT superfamily N-acetyltransferase
MPVSIIPVSTKKQLKQFIRYNYLLYKNNHYSVPDLFSDMLNTLNPKKNAAFEFCEAQCFLAYRDEKIVGRVAALINHKANKKWNVNAVRFDWIDFIDDIDVSKALIDTVMQWGKDRGMDCIEGPLGFTDFDPEGMLVEGFDQPSTMITIYNYPYYPEHLKKLGFETAATWIEMRLTVPSEVPEKHIRIANIVKEKYHLHIVECDSMKQLAKSYGKAIFDLLNESYSHLFGYSELSDKQVRQYIDMYLSIVDRRMISMVADENDNLVAVGISMPSMSNALRKAKGRFLPFGWWHLLRALFFKRDEVLDLMLVAVKPSYQNKGVNALLMADLVPRYIEMGFKYGETNCELIENIKVQSMWEFYNPVVHKRRCAFKRNID